MLVFINIFMVQTCDMIIKFCLLTFTTIILFRLVFISKIIAQLERALIELHHRSKDQNTNYVWEHSIKDNESKAV